MNEIQTKIRNCLWLSNLNSQAGLPPNTVRKILSIWPNLDSLVEAPAKQLTEVVAGPPEKIKRMLAFLRDKQRLLLLDEQARTADEQGIRAIYFADPEYPSRLKQISRCPLVLFYRGERFTEIMAASFFVTVIGTRSPTQYGRIVTEQITEDLARQGVVIISGLARGIDALAHQAALNAGGQTIAVVGSGPDLCYPRENQDLMKKIAASGLIISEYPPGTFPLKQNFPARNRILSGMADAVAVIEASRRSGTMITAGFAGEQGRDVYAVPGSILSPYSQGCNQLIRDGAELLTAASDMLWRLPSGLIQTQLEQSIQREVAEIGIDLPGSAGRIYKRICKALRSHPMSMTDLSDYLNLTLPETAVLLTGLEIDGRLICERGRYSLTQAALSCI